MYYKYRIYFGMGEAPNPPMDEYRGSGEIPKADEPSVLQKIGRLCLQILWVSLRMIIAFILAICILGAIIIIFDL